MRSGSWFGAACAALALVGVAAPASVGAASADDDISGDYVMVRRVTSDSGWFGLDTIDTTDNFMHEARTYAIVTIGGVVDGAAELSVTSRYIGESEFFASDPFAATLRDGVISFVNETYDVCLSTATGEYDGPREALLTSTLEARQTKTPGIFAGAFTYAAENPASAECEAEDIGFTADAWLIHPDAGQAVAAPGVYAGQYVSDDLVWQAEYSVRECTDGEGCDIVVRYGQVLTEPDGAASEQVIDVFMLATGDGGYAGGATYTGDCVDDGAVLIAEDAYDVRVSAVAAFYDLGDGEQALVLDKEEQITTGKVSDDIAAQCRSYAVEHVFAGLPIDRPADWTAPAANS